MKPLLSRSFSHFIVIFFIVLHVFDKGIFEVASTASFGSCRVFVKTFKALGVLHTVQCLLICVSV